jgi:histidinol-phosphate/aromatic aminotransferase/cobyric acid decarboxylase-like protein
MYCEVRLRNLLSVVEAGVDLQTVDPRIKEVEREREWLNEELAKARRMVKDRHVIRDAASEAANFIFGLEGQFRTASILAKKLLLRKVVEGILVDRDRDEVVLTLTRLPKIDNPILNAIRDGAVLSVN